MVTVAVLGLAGPLAARVRSVLQADDRVGSVVDLDDLTPRVALSKASANDVEHLVVVSSAMVYGAWADNSVPLTEDAPLRPNPGCDEAAFHGETERLAREWVEDREGATLGILRPTTVVGVPQSESSSAVPLPVRHGTAPVQFLHADDLVAAIELAVANRVSGTYNVAPDGSVPHDTAWGLVHGPLTVPLPERVARGAASVARRLGGRRSPASVAYSVHPWVVANDRLRAEGWKAEHTNEEAWVLSHPGSVLQELGPDRRQLLALGVSGSFLAGVAALVALLFRRARRG